MGKHPDPSAEELELIFNAIARGLDDVEIMEEMQSTESTARSRRFMRQRRLHYDVAKRLLHAELEREINPVITQQRGEHFTQLTEIAQALIAGNLDNVAPICPEEGSDRVEYVIMGGTEPSQTIGLGGMRAKLDENLDRACGTFSFFTVMDYFVPHLKAEQLGFASEGISREIQERPYELIEILRVLANRRTFKGTCPVCEDW